MFTAFFWNLMYNKFIYYYLSEPNSNNQVVLSKNSTPFLLFGYLTILSLKIFLISYFPYNQNLFTQKPQPLLLCFVSVFLFSTSLASEIVNILLNFLAIQYTNLSTLAITACIYKHWKNINKMISSCISCCTLTLSLFNITQSILTTPTDFPLDLTKKYK